MAGSSRSAEVGRGERVVPGVWRLRLPLPLAGVPHCNAWALAAGDGIVLVDCGMDVPGSMGQLERALEQVGLRVEHIRLLVCTHAHIDHCGQAYALQERTGCELWIHPRHEHLTARLDDPDAALARSVEVARQSGVPDAAVRRWAKGRKEAPSGMSGPLRPARDLLPGLRVETDLGPWDVYETPGHAPSHVVLHQPQHRLLLSGDHVLGRISLYFDHGWTPDPVGEFLDSLTLVDGLGVRLSLAGHARPFTDLHAHVEGNRALVHERLGAVVGELRARGEATAFELLPAVYGDRIEPETAAWLLTKMLCWLTHLERTGRAERLGDEPSFSFEFFPPKTDEGERNLGRALAELSRLQPTFVSVTYGAAGSTTQKRKTIDIVADLKRNYGMEAMAHFTCVDATVEELRAMLDTMRDAGIENVLALRGDPPAGQAEWAATEGGLKYSRELIEMIRDQYDFAIGAACFPEVHIHATDAESDLRYLKEKVDAGARFLITQMFFDNQAYYDFVARARDIGIDVPIIAGIWPITNVAQIKRVTEMCGAKLPDPMTREFELRADDPGAVADLGVAYATLQSADLLANGAPGIHFYTLNRSPATRAILSALRLMAPWRGAVPA